MLDAGEERAFFHAVDLILFCNFLVFLPVLEQFNCFARWETLVPNLDSYKWTWTDIIEMIFHVLVLHKLWAPECCLLWTGSWYGCFFFLVAKLVCQIMVHDGSADNATLIMYKLNL
jgi:hypothetical protein